MTNPKDPKTPSKTRRRGPFEYRLIARAHHVARDIRRDHGDESIADLITSLAEELQRNMGTNRTGMTALQRDGQEMSNALDRHGFNIAVNALYEIRDMCDKDSLVRAKCRRVLTLLKCDPDGIIRRPAKEKT